MKIYSLSKKGREQIYINSLFGKRLKQYKFMSSLMKLDWVNVKSALASTILMAILAVALYILGLGDVFKIELSVVVNIGAMSLLTGIVSLIKSILTDSNGKLIGVKVK